MLKVLTFKSRSEINPNDELIFYVPENDVPVVPYDSFLKSFDIDTNTENILIKKGLITKKCHVSILDMFCIATFFAKLDKLAIAINIYADAQFPLSEANANIKNKFEILRTMCLASIKNYTFYYEHEEYLYTVIRKQLQTLIPGAKIVTRDIDILNRPDFFLELNNELVVVEVKKDVIDAKAILQLARYMKVYKTKTGIVMAPELTGKLKKGMSFVAVNKNMVTIDPDSI